MIAVLKAPPYLTVQDLGRQHARAAGVPAGGAMDFFALCAANALVGNPPHAAGLEWALGGGSLRFDRDSAFAIAGAAATATLSGRDVAPCSTIYARKGEVLSVEQLTRGRFLYIACSGGVACAICGGLVALSWTSDRPEITSPATTSAEASNNSLL